jgi:hypothetical protein
VLLAGVPSQRSVPTDNLPVFRLHDGHGFGDVVTFGVKFLGRKAILTGTVEQSHSLDACLGEEGADIVMFMYNFTV